jgi:putative ABC transport system permease protein
MNVLLLKLAAVNTTRNLRRTLITLTGIAVGSCCAFIFSGFVENSYWGLSERFARSGNGHIQIAKADWFTSARPELHRTEVEKLERAAKLIQEDPALSKDVVAVSIKRKISGIVSTGERSEVFVGQGVDPEANEQLSTWVNISAGENLDPARAEGVVLGKTLGEKIDAMPGQHASLLLSTDDGRTNAMDVEVTGHVQSVSKDADAVALLLPISTALNLVNSRLADVLVVGLRETDSTAAAAKEVRRLLASDPSLGLVAYEWSEVAEFYQAVRSLYGRIFGFVQLILFIVTLLAVTNTVVMAVTERKQEIGMLRSVGMRQKQLLSLFLTEGVILGLLGGVVGLLVAVLIAQVVEKLGGIPMPPSPGSSQGYTLNFFLTAKVGLVILLLSLSSTILASTYPAWRASRDNIAHLLTGLLLCFALVVPARSAHAASAAALLKQVDAARSAPDSGFETKTKFTNLKGGSDDDTVTYHVVSSKGRVLALAVSDPASSRMSILSSGKGMWMQKTGMRKAIRVSPGQRLMGQASNADVVSVDFGTDYRADSLKPGKGKDQVLVLKPKSDNAAYGKIELHLINGKPEIREGLFYAISGALLKKVKYNYKGGRITSTIISDAVRTDQQTRVDLGAVKARSVPESFFNPDNILESSQRM